MNAIQRIRCINPETLMTLEDYVQKGVPIKEISKKWNVSKHAVYYWIYKINLPIKEIKHKLNKENNKLNIDKKPIKKYTYFYYIQKDFKQGGISREERNRNLNQYYQNRYKYV